MCAGDVVCSTLGWNKLTIVPYASVYGKTRPKSLCKIWRKWGKVKKNLFFSKDGPLIHFIFSKDGPSIQFIHPNVQKYIQKCLKIAPNVIKHFPRPTFQNVITRKIFEIL
jgi:hypothetical protein